MPILTVMAFNIPEQKFLFNNGNRLGPSFLAFVFDAKAWRGRGGGIGIHESIGRDLDYHP
jgi:hypothetical protein